MIYFKYLPLVFSLIFSQDISFLRAHLHPFLRMKPWFCLMYPHLSQHNQHGVLPNWDMEQEEKTDSVLQWWWHWGHTNRIPARQLHGTEHTYLAWCPDTTSSLCIDQIPPAAQRLRLQQILDPLLCWPVLRRQREKALGSKPGCCQGTQPASHFHN